MVASPSLQSMSNSNPSPSLSGRAIVESSSSGMAESSSSCGAESSSSGNVESSSSGSTESSSVTVSSSSWLLQPENGPVSIIPKLAIAKLFSQGFPKLPFRARPKFFISALIQVIPALTTITAFASGCFSSKFCSITSF